MWFSNQKCKMREIWTSGQDGGVGRYTLPPCTTKQRTATHLKTKNNQNWQKIELVWKSNNQGVKEEPFIQTGRRGGDGQPGWRGHEARLQLEDQGRWGGGWSSRWSHICVWINREEQLGIEADHTTEGSRVGEIKPQNLWLKKPVEVEVAGETPSLTGEFFGETHRVLKCTQNHPPENQHQKGPICLWVAGEVTESWQRAEQEALFPLRPLPHIQCHNARR